MPEVFTIEQMRKKREQLKISQSKMANILKVSWRTYQKYEKVGDMLLSQAIRCTEYLKKTEELENNIKNKKIKKTKK